MTGADPDELVARLVGLPIDELLRLAVDVADKDPAAAVPRAIRDQARKGLLDDEAYDLIPVLCFLLNDAPTPRALHHYAKALAAFGRDAAIGGPLLAARLDELFVTDDEGFWIFDGCLHALSFLGGDAARALVLKLGTEQPPRVVRSQSVYAGEMEPAERRAHFGRTLVEVRARLDGPPAVWRERLTTMERGAAKKAVVKTSPWMTRGAPSVRTR